MQELFYHRRTSAVFSGPRSIQGGETSPLGISQPLLRLLSDGVHFKLCLDKTLVDPALFHKLVMTALLGDAVIVNNDNAVGIFKGRKAVGNGKGGASRFKAVDGPLYHKFAFGVEAGGE